MGEAAAPLVKCVVWDLDGTVWAETLLELDEGGGLPPVSPGVADAIARLDAHGVLNAIASRNAPDVVDLVRADPVLSRAVAVEVGWGAKSDAVRRIAQSLDLSTESLVFVDDNPFERAEVEALVPGVRALAPEALLDSLDELLPAAVTEEGRRRPELYRQRAAREQAAAGLTRDEFLASCEIVATVGLSRPGDRERVLELFERTTQYNSVGQKAACDGDLVVTVRLRDRFGDEGLVGAACVTTATTTSAWVVAPLAASCRVAGRGALHTLLVWLAERAAGDGAVSITVPVVPSSRNVPLRVALRQAGFVGATTHDGDVVFTLDVTATRPPRLPWVRVDG